MSARPFVAFLMVLSKLVETMRPHARESNYGFGLSDQASLLVDTSKPPRHLRGFYIAITVDLVAFGTGYHILYSMQAKGYGYTPSVLGILFTVMTGSMALARAVHPVQ